MVPGGSERDGWLRIEQGMTRQQMRPAECSCEGEAETPLGGSKPPPEGDRHSNLIVWLHVACMSHGGGQLWPLTYAAMLFALAQAKQASIAFALTKLCVFYVGAV